MVLFRVLIQWTLGLWVGDPDGVWRRMQVISVSLLSLICLLQKKPIPAQCDVSLWTLHPWAPGPLLLAGPKVPILGLKPSIQSGAGITSFQTDFFSHFAKAGRVGHERSVPLRQVGLLHKGFVEHRCTQMRQRTHTARHSAPSRWPIKLQMDGEKPTYTGDLLAEWMKGI